MIDPKREAEAVVAGERTKRDRVAILVLEREIGGLRTNFERHLDLLKPRLQRLPQLGSGAGLQPCEHHSRTEVLLHRS